MILMWKMRLKENHGKNCVLLVFLNKDSTQTKSYLTLVSIATQETVSERFHAMRKIRNEKLDTTRFNWKSDGESKGH